MLKKIKKLIPQSLRLGYHVLKKRVQRFILQKTKVARMRKKNVINVLFIAYTPAMWKIDSLYQAFKQNLRFNADILVVPHMGIKDIEERNKGLQKLRQFFKNKNYAYKEWSNVEGKSVYDHIPEQYDIVFYPQGYPDIVPQPLDFPNNTHKLLIDCEYAFHSGNQNWAYNKWYQNEAWLDLYENESTWKLSRKTKTNKGINSIITGLPFMDDFRKSTYTSPWKPQENSCKKIIWAPHWTITEESGYLPSYSNFIEMAEFMLQYAKTNIGRLQFAFKPHPRLKQELYEHKDWGKEKTNNYYQMWEKGINTQLEEGEYINLFMTSDALIHDSSSFCCEYMFTGKPILFIAKNEKKQVELLNEMAYSAFYSQYIGHSNEDIEDFITNKIVKKDDPFKEKRMQFVENYLTPPNGHSAAENIVAAILGND